MKILLQDKNFVITNNSLISINSDNIAENGNLVKIKQSSEKNDILKINNSLVRAKVAPDPPIVNNTETWVINSNYSSTASILANVKFKSNNISYNSISIRIAPAGNCYIKYDNTTACNIMANMAPNFVAEATWTNKAYRTITLDEPATGTLLTWLQTNAVKQ